MMLTHERKDIVALVIESKVGDFFCFAQISKPYKVVDTYTWSQKWTTLFEGVTDSRHRGPSA